MLTFKGVSHHYGEFQSAHSVDLDIGEGAVVSLLGPSGCGKTTILRLAAGLERPSAGEIVLDGETVAGGGRFVPPERRRVGLVFQDYALFPHMTVAENILYGLNGGAGAGLDSASRRSRMEEVLEQVDLMSYADAFPHMLSGGQQQRVALARSLAPNPRIMLLDEPYAGLDSRLRERIRDDTLHVLKASGTTVLLVTHDSEEAMFMSDHIHVMEQGRIRESGRPIDLYCRPQSAFVAEFFGEVNHISGPVVNGKLETPFGRFGIDGGGDASEASLIIRHEALLIDGDGKPNAEVVETRLLGRYSLIHLSMPMPDGDDLHLHARIPGLNMIPPGERVSLSVDRDQVFVFTD